MIYFGYRFPESEASRCLDLVARNAPRLMREGGGALPEEKEAGVTYPVTTEEIQRFNDLRAEGKTNLEISKMTGRSVASVQRWLKKPGEKRCRQRMTDKKAAILQLLPRESNLAEIARQVGTTRCYVGQVKRALAA